tara:strand:+ start:2518 stop:3672 length:1155 start_codon:yes stop_codon:yes gene_type:complete
MSKSLVNNAIQRFEKNCKGPTQLSKEWLAIREKGTRKRGRVGGSDLASLIGANPYQSRKELMKIKMGHKKKVFGNQFPLLFGSIFEEVAVNSFEKIFKTKVFAKNISILDPQGFTYMIFSPDGLCALPIKDGEICLDYDEDEYNKITEFVPVLIEVKCPSTRPLVKNDVAPPQYVPQIQGGMLAIDIAHAGLFIDNQIRVCSYQQLFTSHEHNNQTAYSIHLKSSKVNEDIDPIHIGAILVYGALPDSINKQYLRVEEIGEKKVYDLGNATSRTFTDVLAACKSNVVRYEYLPPCDDVDELNIVDAIRDTSETEIGIISWKIFDVSYTLVNKDLEFIQRIVTKLHEYQDGIYDLEEPLLDEATPLKKKDTIMPSVNLSFDSDSD